MSDRAEALRCELQFDKTTAGLILDCLDAADKDAGIYRLSLAGAVEAAAKARFADYRLVATGWADASEATREDCRKAVRPIITAAVMGGAQ